MTGDTPGSWSVARPLAAWDLHDGTTHGAPSVHSKKPLIYDKHATALGACDTSRHARADFVCSLSPYSLSPCCAQGSPSRSLANDARDDADLERLVSFQLLLSSLAQVGQQTGCRGVGSSPRLPSLLGPRTSSLVAQLAAPGQIPAKGKAGQRA